MSGLSFKLDPSPSLPDKPLESADDNLVGGTVSYEVEPELAGIKFAFGVEANARIMAFNSPSDEDTTGVPGQPVEVETGFGEVKLPPQIHLTGPKAWLKYFYSASAKASVGGGRAARGI